MEEIVFEYVGLQMVDVSAGSSNVKVKADNISKKMQTFHLLGGIMQLTVIHDITSPSAS